MRTSIPLPRPPRRRRQAKVPHCYCEAAGRACELAAMRVKGASDELSAHWMALTQQVANGVPTTDLLRARSWCQVLETRLMERIAALDQARQQLDDAWQQAAVATGQPGPLSELPQWDAASGHFHHAGSSFAGTATVVSHRLPTFKRTR